MRLDHELVSGHFLLRRYDGSRALCVSPTVAHPGRLPDSEGLYMCGIAIEHASRPKGSTYERLLTEFKKLRDATWAGL